MAARIKIEDVANQPIAGSPLVITGAAGVDAHGYRMVTVSCSRCGSTDTTHRLAQVLRLEITSCGCAERDANKAYRKRGVDTLTKPQRIAIYESVESGVPAEKIAMKYGRDKYTIHDCWLQEQKRVDALPEAKRSAIVWLALSGTAYADLAKQFGVGVHAIAGIVSAWKRQQGSTSCWHATMEYMLENQVYAAVYASEEAKKRWLYRGEYTKDEFQTGSRAKGSEYGPTYELLLKHDPAVFTAEFREKAITFLQACRFTKEGRAARKRKYASSAPVIAMTSEEPESYEYQELAAA